MEIAGLPVFTSCMILVLNTNIHSIGINLRHNAPGEYQAKAGDI